MYHPEADFKEPPDPGRIDLGPESLLWRWAGDTRIAFMGATIGLLQLMHPAIGAGVLEHSDFFGDPYGRVFRSLPRILGAVYDGREADATGREVRDFHRTIKGVDDHGRRYHALDPDTFWWAHATFQYMVEQVADRFDRHRLTPDEREQLYQEGIEWYRRYGVSDRSVPADRAAFQEKWDFYCAEVLELNAASSWVLDSLRSSALSAEPLVPPQLALLRPLAKTTLARHSVFRVVRMCAFGGLPPVVRERFGIEWSSVDAVALDGLELAVRNAWPIVPATVRWQPRALEGWQRVRAEQQTQAA
ncbi:MAG TPA: oxygenase MpaB family protein [Acidimicrobiales bacterium]